MMGEFCLWETVFAAVLLQTAQTGFQRHDEIERRGMKIIVVDEGLMMRLMLLRI